MMAPEEATSQPSAPSGPSEAPPSSQDAVAPGAQAEVASGRTSVPPTRVGRTWVAIGIAALAFIVVIVFILQNLQSVTVTFFTATGRIPLAVALLCATVLGALVAVAVGSLRIVQLRREVRRRSRHRGQKPNPASSSPATRAHPTG